MCALLGGDPYASGGADTARIAQPVSFIPSATVKVEEGTEGRGAWNGWKMRLL